MITKIKSVLKPKKKKENLRENSHSPVLGDDATVHWLVGKGQKERVIHIVCIIQFYVGNSFPQFDVVAVALVAAWIVIK